MVETKQQLKNTRKPIIFFSRNIGGNMYKAGPYKPKQFSSAGANIQLPPMKLI